MDGRAIVDGETKQEILARDRGKGGRAHYSPPDSQCGGSFH
jgi:hypothetical protein